ncbi:sensor histidine kinase [Paracoccus nototheniae]|uniref:histidine kinase n=1 Tax=Paracoccus nototheniae TaxID=2489002 RepID=A0ABW4DYU1_9RHOB|nr:ATP-binding protein [Paracoccus nototheniae]
MNVKKRHLALVAAGLALILAIWQADRLAQTHALQQGQERAETALSLTENALGGYLARYQAIPQLLAGLEAVRDLASHPDDPARRGAINRLLDQRNALLESSDIYLMRPDGLTIAASNHAQPQSFVGQRFDYRPYFTQALQGQPGRFFGLGTTSGVRGYYFSAPVHDAQGRIAAVIAVKIALDAVEASWRARDLRIFVTDPDGVLFMASRADWRYRVIMPDAGDWRARMDPTQRYDGQTIRPLTRSDSVSDAVRLTQIADDQGRREYIAVSRPMPEAGWTVHVLLDTAELRSQAQMVVLLLILLGCVLGAGALILGQRRARIAERLAMQIHATAELERRVDERTADLARMNRRLQAEIAERRATEAELRAAQDSLVQVGKLAALGQMSAALSHEINQPLAAARNYADSAAILIERGDSPRARDNVRQIVALLDRISAIGKHLRNAARKPGDRLGPVALAPLLVETRMILACRLAATDAELLLDLPADLPPVLAGPTRLQQVLVNLLGNAIDAVSGAPDRRIILTAHAGDGTVTITVRDHGPGVPTALAGRIFDPFFTTKGPGAGMGLGLSISATIVRDLGGQISCEDGGPGALFRVCLPVAQSDRVAA